MKQDEIDAIRETMSKILRMMRRSSRHYTIQELSKQLNIPIKDLEVCLEHYGSYGVEKAYNRYYLPYNRRIKCSED